MKSETGAEIPEYSRQKECKYSPPIKTAKTKTKQKTTTYMKVEQFIKRQTTIRKSNRKGSKKNRK